MAGHDAGTSGRRSFLEKIAMAARGAAGLILGVPAVRFLADPLMRRRADAGFIRVAELSAVPEDRPIRVEVTAARRDAYMQFPPGPIGSVWLIRETTDAGESEAKAARDGESDVEVSPAAEPARVRCLQTICPHLGCGTDFRSERGGFACPCHASDFDLAGRRLTGPSPRDLDSLECRVTAPDGNGRRWVEIKFQKFQTGTPDKREIA